MERITLERLIAIVQEAAGRMRTEHFEVFEKEGAANIVTSSDVAVQEFLCERLSEAMPGSGFLCEESDRWVMAITLGLSTR